MKGFISIPADWVGGNIYLSPIYINVNAIAAVYMREDGKFIETVNGERYRLSVPMRSILEMIAEAVGDEPSVSVKCSGSGIAAGVIKGDMTIDHRSRTVMHQNATNVVNIKNVEKFEG